LKAFSVYLCVFIACASLVSCGGQALRWTPEYHTVRSGETLYSIAWQYNIDYRTLARWNDLGDGTLIRPGQQIRLTGPDSGSSAMAATSKENTSTATAPAAPAPQWRWPTDGKLALGFGQSPKTQSGIRITGQTGQSVVAAADGQVVYAGSGLIGYGQLAIIKHNASYLSAYGYNSVLLVAEGQQITAGQKIARMGETSSQQPALHFEIRRNGKPVDPLDYLPSR
jgi:lipoprotein NlpD